jgi:hypothetical protein
MKHAFEVMALGCAIFPQLLIPSAKSQPASPQRALASASAPADFAVLPPAPRGKSTILGGEIVKVDPVRDELTLKIAGQRQTKILFDSRTQVFRDGVKMSLHEIAPTDHASVQTLLDGTDVYALSIHVLSRSPEGEYQGRVIRWNPDARELTVNSTMSRELINLIVPVNTPVIRVGQPVPQSSEPGLFNLVRNTMVSVQFVPVAKGHAVASQITVLASPGSVFVFSGELSALDIHAGMLVLIDPRDQASYQISFDSAHVPASYNLHLEDHVTVTAKYDGTRYVASSIAAD